MLEQFMALVFRTPKEVYVKWLHALRSGKYKQGFETLRTKSTCGVSYCCLGVLQDLCVKDGGSKWDEKTENFLDRSIPLSFDSQPTDNILEYLNLETQHIDRLIIMNDEYNNTFHEIADYIEYIVMPQAMKNM
jgi:hypothetical protein